MKKFEAADPTFVKQIFELATGVVAVLGTVAGALIYIAGISGKADIAIAKNVEQDQRLDRQKDFMQEQNKLIITVKEDVAHIRGVVDGMARKSE